MNDKEIALAFEMGDAPEELKKAAEEHRQNYLRRRKAQQQQSLWVQENQEASDAFEVSLKKFNRALDNWEPKDSGVETVKEVKAAKVKK